MTTVIGSTLVIEGDIVGEDRVVVRGSVEGKVVTRRGVMVERGGRLLADLEVESAYVAGEVVGNIAATGRVEISADGRLVGDVRASRIVLAEGSYIKGAVETEALGAARGSADDRSMDR